MVVAESISVLVAKGQLEVVDTLEEEVNIAESVHVHYSVNHRVHIYR